MASVAVEKTAEELRKEIAELQRQQWEITERLRNPRGIRRASAGAGTGVGPGTGAGGPRLRGVIRTAPEMEEQPVSKRRLSSAVVKVDGEENKDGGAEAEDPQVQDPAVEVGASSGGESSKVMPGSVQINEAFRRDGSVRLRKMQDYDAIPTETVPRVLPKEDDPNLVKRNRRMLGQLLGTLEKFREEDKQLSSTEAYMRRSDSLKRAEQKAREESERLRQQEREQISEKRRRDLTLRARVAAKAEEKKLELLFLFWAEHHKKLSNFLRTKTEPPIYYMPAKPLVEDAILQEQQKEQAFQEWKSLRRAELSEYQKQIEENYISNVDKELERWQNARNARRSNNLANLQESMDKELETHRLVHGPKTRRISGGNDEDEDVEDIVIEDELLDEVLEPHDRPEADATKIPEISNGGSGPA
ncbi:pinin isoform X1 [Dendrobium catenatum]|uniref:pinin isoform X1 n=1 Tax=Dendrobium catenatum TaxID=906689 RepID=UPI0009F732EF|nr:pinin isoform X1 [Dendrobium catenatum]